ncbi:c-type cytochrome [Salipiger marinus]|jgi:cytochrome c556|uniref:Cytochrome c556 n=1 Tax=Salipiger marinus TaxID=555512 RepID=A0A1G8TQC5_9RHOB|nr:MULTISPECIES: cytochrome c [Salipiger]HBT00154.1 cytochrome C554 [Citreicella sp.]MCD1619480.1 cytochrome c [Salipiger manganoxidans]MEB3420314.1 cytochrome c [Salipiger manganoxidans]SDI93654.1 Cytochrome c556 [Salipiger marinus]SDJ43748.1 Cytochrome c556 [Salipiger marinus]
MKMTIAAAAGVALLATGALAQEQDLSGNVKARQGQFRIMAINLGILGDMAQGKTEYDAEAAQAAADTLVAVSTINQPPLWPEGSSEMDMDGTRAKAEIWDNMDDFASKWAGFGEAASAMQQVAATGQEAIGPAMGGLGGACKACHDTYRAPQ